MGTSYRNEKGFTAVEAILLVVVIAIIGAAGWFVYKSHHKSAPATTNAAVTNTSNNNPAPAPKNSVTYKTYSDSAAQASFQYPESFTLSSIKGLCDEPNGCAPSTDKISAVELTSTDKTVKIIWSGISGIGGYCDNTVPPTKGGCTIQTVFSSTPIPKSDGLYVVAGAMEVSSGKYQPFLAVQDKTGVRTSGEQGLWYQHFKLPTTGLNTLFYMNNGYKDSGGGTNPTTFSTLSQAKTYMNSSDIIQAKFILLSLQVK